MMLDVYVGFLDDPKFKWEGGDWNGNTPTRQSKFFIHGYDMFFAIVRKIRAEEFEGKQVDWGAWVAKLTPSEIELFMDEFYEKKPPYTESGIKDLEEIKSFIKALDPSKQYALVASEL